MSLTGRGLVEAGAEAIYDECHEGDGGRYARAVLARVLPMISDEIEREIRAGCCKDHPSCLMDGTEDVRDCMRRLAASLGAAP